MKELVLFDIDGTIIKGQSQMLFLKYLLLVKKISRTFYLKLLPWFVLYRIGLVKDPKKPMRYAYSFLRGKSVEEVALWIDDFFEKQLKHFVYSDAVEVIHEHQNLGRTVILVSNAMEPIVKKLAAYLDVDNYISTTLEVIDGHYTGNIIDMVYGDNKAAAVERFVDNNSLGLETAWAYADHVSDEPILTRVRHPYVVNASRSLLTFARQNQWPSLTFEKLTK